MTLPAAFFGTSAAYIPRRQRSMGLPIRSRNASSEVGFFSSIGSGGQMCMFLARVQYGLPPQVYPLNGRLFFEPRSWLFMSYRRGACAIDYTSAKAVKAARRRLGRPKT